MISPTQPPRTVEYRGGGPMDAPDPRMGWAWFVLALFLVGTLICMGGCPGSQTPARRLAVVYCGATEMCQRAWYQLHYGPDADPGACVEDAYVEVLDLGLSADEAEELREILQGAVVDQDCGAYNNPSLVYGIGAVAGNLGIYGSRY